MKHFLLISIILLMSTILLCAQTKEFKPFGQYSKHQLRKKKTANTLLIAGGAGLTVGILLASTPSDNAMSGSFQTLSGMGLVGFGAISSLVSIPFYIDAYYDRKKIGQIQPTFSYTKTPHHKFPQMGMKLTF